MVDLSEIQAAYYMVATTGVLIAAVFYILNMRETIRNRRATLTQSMMETFSSVEGFKRLLQLYYMEWSDFDDFMEKYDSKVNPENAAIRHNVWDRIDVIGYQWRQGILDRETIWSVVGNHITTLWVRFKPIIEEYRRTELGEDAYSDWEYLAKEVAKISAKRSPSFKSQVFTKPGEYEKVFGKLSITP